MKTPDGKPPRQPEASLSATLFVLLFGLAALTFLVAVDRVQWFHIRPISAATSALYFAANGPDKPEAKPEQRQP